MKYDCISHPTPWPREHSVLVGLAAEEVAANLSNEWVSMMHSLGFPSNWPWGWEQSECHGQGKFTQLNLEQHSQTGCCFKSRAALMLLMGVGLEEGTDPAPSLPAGCRSPLVIPGGNYTPGELALPLQRAAPMAKAKACLNPACFLLKSCVCTYICIIWVYI